MYAKRTVVATLLGWLLLASPAQAEQFELPRAPYERDPTLAFEVHLASVFPVASAPICPPSADCVLGGGAGMGGSLERRWPFGVAVALAYDAWFLDGNGVYELSVMQAVGAQVRYYALAELIVHPFAGAGLSALVFGDTFRVETAGIGLELSLGVEIELTESFGLIFAVPWRLFSTLPFTTTHDRVDRAQDGGGNAAAAFQLGLSVVETP
jgi:hypothetical protein